MSSDAQRDRRWIEGIRNQDSNVLNEIYKNIQPGIISWIKQNNGNEQDARDVFQDAIIAIYKKCKKDDFELTCKFWSFALIICKNLWFARNRNKDRMTYTDVIDEDEVRLDETMQDQMEAYDQLLLYRKHFKQLPDSCRQILSMFFAKIKMSEIAEKLDMTEAYVKKRKFKCKEALIQNIKEDELYEELKV